MLGNKLIKLHKEKENGVIYPAEYQRLKKQSEDGVH